MKRNLILALMFVVTIVAVSCGFQAPTYIPNGSGADVRNAINNALKSVMSQHSAPTEPSNAQPFMYWVDTSTTPPTTRQRNAANTAWDVVPEYMDMTGATRTSGFFAYSVNNGGSYPTGEFIVAPEMSRLSVTNSGSDYSEILLQDHDITIRSNGGAMYIKTSAAPPATAGSDGVVGEVRFDTNYMYRCTATNTWKRIPMSTW